MKFRQIKPVAIAAGQTPLFLGQKMFNGRIKQIGKLRVKLAAWEEATAACLGTSKSRHRGNGPRIESVARSQRSPPV